MASSAWSPTALASLTLVTMRGSPSAMAFWTAFPSMLVLGRQVGNVRCGTMLSVTLPTSGLRGQVGNQNGEEPGLLLPPEETGLGRRHPTDVSVPSLAAIPTAFDVAVTAPQRSESLREASCKTGAAADFYAEIKAAHDRTAQLCGNQGVRFQPLVFESAGAWSTSASHNLRPPGLATAAREGKNAAACQAQLYKSFVSLPTASAVG